MVFEKYEGLVSEVNLLGGGPRRSLRDLDENLYRTAEQAAEAIMHHKGVSDIVMTP